MSWNISLKIDTGGPELAGVYECGNMTYNVSPMYAKALGCDSFSDFLQGKICADLVPHLERAVSAMYRAESIADYKALNPPNGCGSYEGALEYLESILKACRLHPKATVHVY